jgi:hypothetical protein
MKAEGGMRKALTRKFIEFNKFIEFIELTALNMMGGLEGNELVSS